MRMVRYAVDGAVHVGVMGDDEPTVIREVDVPLAELLATAATGSDAGLDLAGTRDRALDDVHLLAPLVDGARGMWCIGINYHAHQQESADVFLADAPEAPVVFWKIPSTVTGPYDDIVVDAAHGEQFDWEVELGVVIGRAADRVPPEAAADHVAGFTVVNDVSARGLQVAHKQWFLGKNVPASTPAGPWIASRAAVGDAPDLEVRLTVNGEEKQRARTKELIFDVADLISTISHVVPLRVGDVIATGTPQGVGFRREPPEFLQDGDVVEATIEHVGSIRNRFRTRD